MPIQPRLLHDRQGLGVSILGFLPRTQPSADLTTDERFEMTGLSRRS